VIRTVLVVAALAAAAPAAAQVQGSSTGPSPRWGSVDVGVDWYRPRIDADFPKGDGPYEKMFGNRRGWMLNLGVSKALFTSYGSLEVGFRTGYFDKAAKGLLADGSRAGSDSSFRIIPTSAALTYRLDVAVERWRVPFAPYARVAFERYNWWVTKGTGGTVEKGATMGWSAAAGLAFLLDVVDPTLAREFDRDSGVNHTYLFFEIQTGKIDDFGSSKSWDLSPDWPSLAGGLTFVF
jgi:hypothetical protein